MKLEDTNICYRIKRKLTHETPENVKKREKERSQELIPRQECSVLALLGISLRSRHKQEGHRKCAGSMQVCRKHAGIQEAHRTHTAWSVRKHAGSMLYSQGCSVWGCKGYPSAAPHCQTVLDSYTIQADVEQQHKGIPWVSWAEWTAEGKNRKVTARDRVGPESAGAGITRHQEHRATVELKKGLRGNPEEGSREKIVEGGLEPLPRVLSITFHQDHFPDPTHKGAIWNGRAEKGVASEAKQFIQGLHFTSI